MTDLGLVGIVNKGTYNSGTTYMSGNFVYYANSSWLCILDGTVGVTPSASATTNWQLMARGYELIDNATTDWDDRGKWALDAAMGKKLADAIPPIKFTANDTVTVGVHKYNVPTNSRHVIFLSSTSVHGIAFMNCISDHRVFYYEAGGSFTNWSADTSSTGQTTNDNTIEFTNGTSGTVDMLIMTLRGGVPTEVTE